MGNNPPKSERTEPASEPSVTTPTDPLELFVHCFNVCYPDWEIKGDATKELTEQHVQYSNRLRKTWGRCGPTNSHEVVFKVNTDWWEKESPENRLGLIIHELAHVKHTHHKPSFWDQTIRNYNRLKTQSETITEVMQYSVDWDGVDEWMVTDPQTHQVDKRTENVWERRLTIADAIGYPTEDIEPFTGVSPFIKIEEGSMQIPFEKITNWDVPEDELREWFSQRSRDGVTLRDHRYTLELPTVKEVEGNKYEIVEGQERAAMMYYTVRDTYLECLVRRT